VTSALRTCPGAQLRVAVYGAWGGSPPVAIQVRGDFRPDQRIGFALAAVDSAWPEHHAWAQRAFDRGDFWVTESGPEAGDVWFFEGEEGEALAGL
jgi:hypothetical protein